MLATSRRPLGLTGEHLFPVPPLSVPDPADPAGPGRGRAPAAGRRLQPVRRGHAAGRPHRGAAPRLRRHRRPTPPPWPGSAPGSTGCRWPSSWPPAGCGRCRPSSSPTGWSERFAAADQRAARRPSRGSRPCGRCSTGATRCARRRSGCSGPGCRCSRAASTWRPPRRSARAPACPASADPRSARPARGPVHRAGRAARRRGCGSGCWRPSGSTAGSGWPRPARSRRCGGGTATSTWRLARAQAAEWFGPRQEAGLARLRAEHANLRAALEASVADPAGPGPALAFVTALRCHWYADGYLAEGRTWLDHALSLPAGPARGAADRVHALWVAAWVSLLQGDVSALSRLDECDALAAALGDQRAAGFSRSLRGTAELFAGRIEPAIALFEEALASFGRIGENEGSGVGPVPARDLAWPTTAKARGRRRPAGRPSGQRGPRRAALPVLHPVGAGLRHLASGRARRGRPGPLRRWPSSAASTTRSAWR